MHPRFALIALAAMLLVPSPALAQEAEAPIEVLADDAGDVSAYADSQAGETPVAVPQGTFDSADLRGLSITETPTEFQFHLALTTLDGGPSQSILAAIQYVTTFRHSDNVYLMRIYDSGDDYYGALELMSGDPDEPVGSFVADVTVTADAATATLTAAVPRDAIVDKQGAAPYPGRVLDLFSVKAGYLNDASISLPFATAPWAYVEDRMPDEGPLDAVLPVRLGIEQTGQLRLTSTEPFRASNGESATFVFRVNATNLAREEQRAEFVAVGAPMGWDVRLPGLVRLDPNETAEFPVIVHTEFMHKHGTATAFTLELASQSDPDSVGRIQLGLRYPKIAQPAGHHNTVYFHDLDESDDPLRRGLGLVNKAVGGYDYLTFPYLNTALPEEDPEDAITPVPGQECEALRIQDDDDLVGTTYCWRMPLRPGLEMGLDFDLGALGAYAIPIHSLVPQPATRVQGRVVYYAPDEQVDPFFYSYSEPTVVATLLTSDRIDLDVDDLHVFEGIIQPEEDGDFLAYQRGASLELQLEVRTGRADNPFLGPRTEPDLTPGGWMQLPLLEYEDPIDEVFGVANHLHLMLDGDSHRMGNPGDTVVFEVTLHNADDQAHDYEATLTGSNDAWGRLVGAKGFAVDADGSRVLTVAVTVPADAFDDDRADLVLEVTSTDDASIRALTRLVTTADLDAEHDDQASLVSQEASPKDTPAPSAVLLAIALLGLALRRR
ncbi:MAG: FixG Ig-like domain-containing protein [Candidatus Thermoplasmatota archaeon]